MSDPHVSFFKVIFDAGLGYIWFIFLAIWGGTVNYITRRKADKNPFSVIELIGQEMAIPLMYTYAAAGIAGHMGGRGIYLLEAFMHKRIGLSGK